MANWLLSLIGLPSNNIAEVNANKELQVALSEDKDDAGFAKILDSGGNEVSVTENGALSVSLDSLIFIEQVDGSALNPYKWTTSVSGMTITQAAGFITLNAAAATTANAYAILQSVAAIPLFGHLPTRLTCQLKAPVPAQANFTMEFGIGTVATNAAPSDGAYFRWTPATEFRAIINNGSEVPSAALSQPTTNNCTLFDIIIVEDLVQFFIDDEKVAEIEVPIGLAYPVNSGRLPIFLRVYNGSSTPAQAPQLALGQLVVVQEGVAQNRAWPEFLAMMGQGGYQLPVSPFGQTGNHANSASPSTIATGSQSNTVAAYATPGGQFALAAPTGAATDILVFAFQVPANYQGVIKGITIDTVNTGAAVLGTATVLNWFAAVNSSAASLATAESPPTTYGPKRVELGMQAFSVGDLMGKQATQVRAVFEIPLICDGGRYLQIGVQIPVGTATASQVLRGIARIDWLMQ